MYNRINIGKSFSNVTTNDNNIHNNFNDQKRTNSYTET